MIQSLQIKNFKNLHDLTVSKFKRINLIFGANNVGKSSLLEALSLYASKGSLSQIYNILKIRDENLKAFRNDEDLTSEDEILGFLPLVHNFDRATLAGDGIIISELGRKDLIIKLIQIVQSSIKDENGTEFIKNTVYPYGEQVETNSSLSIPVLEIQYNNLSNRSTIDLNGGGVKSPITFAHSNRDQYNFRYLTCREYKLNDIDDLWKTVAMTDFEQYLIRALQIIEPRIERFNIITEQTKTAMSSRFGISFDSIPYVLLKGEKEKRRLSAMGDGINKILYVILSLINCKDGFLLIDELENGLHYSVQTKLWSIINELSEKLNVQVFATTHSLDCIESFISVMNKDEFAAIRLDKIDSEINAQIYDDACDLQYAMNHYIEIR